MNLDDFAPFQLLVTPLQLAHRPIRMLGSTVIHFAITLERTVEYLTSIQ